MAVGVGPLSRADVVAVARAGARVELTAEAYEAMAVSRGHVEALASDWRPHYGVSTGFGALAMRYIPPSQRAVLQQSLVRSHAAGAGPEVEREVVRAMALLRLRTLATGRTGVRPATALAVALAGLLNAGITPVVPEYGSLGCSGDLAPLAAVALALTGEGTVRDASGALNLAGEGTGKAARDWPSFHAISRELAALRQDVTLLVASGRPVGVLLYPRVGAAGAHRQRQPGAVVGDLAGVPPVHLAYRPGVPLTWAVWRRGSRVV